MSFIADKQTLDDLNMLGKFKSNSIYSLFNKVHTTGGSALLEQMFCNPLTDADQINARSCIFAYFQHYALTFPFKGEQIIAMEVYLREAVERNLLFAYAGTLKKQLLAALIKNEDYEQLLEGIQATIAVLKAGKLFINTLPEVHDGHPYFKEWKSFRTILKDSRLAGLSYETEHRQLSFREVVEYDHLFRATLKQEMNTLLDVIYDLDVYIAVAAVGRTKGLSYARAHPKDADMMVATDLRHPGLDKAVSNPVTLHQESNVLFLTGANMAGKSTFMKTFGISMYLAHMGFPIAATEMTFSVKDGIYSSINVPDNLNMGYSHFYAEVLRVKKIAEEVSELKDLVVIFDELFKGTNVKDAYDATLAVTQAFAENRNCFFIISTHIVEVGEALMEKCGNIQFVYLPTVMEGNIPRYTYKLQKGITTDRQGMMIIENEGILEILKASGV